ncbi:glycosyltransferase family 2 protein [Mycolicibacterium goodii]|uniref:Glycosyltransferase family 2 protein n=1 Tax=Mycolicibacterium goodii TaxID=134601 RepID=A0ABS6HQX9_MYCGD|nr:glycosyltransferase family 2 protein [Mycolicibacterium goodii]MBU8823748.1 glycosyltransferase family 2 protein [Mycolicibacterium goodii]MBU8833116.1 glycosyltransferase family 2 protein [Mycolicibacterium goodii]MBU8835920.1 glycosyltransferase family 2 protein [Mycolicibacterium goodii]
MDETGCFVPVERFADIAVVIVTYNNIRQVEELLSDLRREAGRLLLRVVVVDNDSPDGTADVVARHDDVVLIRSGGNLGYAGGINCARPYVAPCTGVLILNPDVRLGDGALATMLSALTTPEVGAVVPLITDSAADEVVLTLRHEPSLSGALVDALVGGRRFPGRPMRLSETNLRRRRYRTPHAVDWATGAAILVRADVDREVGEWDESYFLYSEETDYCRRIRDRGYRVWFEPEAVIRHIGGGSGRSPSLATLQAVNRIRYVERYRNRSYAVVYRAIAAIAEVLRAYDRDHRRTLWTLLRRDRWGALPHATVSVCAAARAELQGVRPPEDGPKETTRCSDKSPTLRHHAGDVRNSTTWIR